MKVAIDPAAVFAISLANSFHVAMHEGIMTTVGAQRFMEILDEQTDIVLNKLSKAQEYMASTGLDELLIADEDADDEDEPAVKTTHKGGRA